MFLYTVYPTVPHKTRKKTTRQIEPVSRIKPVHRVQYNSDPVPTQQTHKIKAKNVPDINQLQSNWEPAADELYMLNVQPLLLAWRQPKVVISPDYIQKYHERLLAIKPKNSRHKRIN